MDVTHSRVIIFLLAAILCVMLFGAGGFLVGLAWGGAAAAILGFLVLAGKGLEKIVSSFRQEVKTSRAGGRPWRWLLIAYPAMAGNLVVIGLAAFDWIGNSVRYRDALGEVPYFWVPVASLFISMVVAAIESSKQWAPSIPSCAYNFFRGWLRLLCSPLLAPLGRWHKMRELKDSGEKIGVFSASMSLIYIFILSSFIWMIVIVAPIILVAIAISSIL